MQKVLLQAAIYLGTMFLGYALKKLGIFRKEDKQVLGNVIVYLTLPAMLISSFNDVIVDFWFLVSLLLGVVCNGTLVFFAWLTARKRPAEIRALYTVNSNGFNLGHITIPFLSGILPQAIPYLCMFDTGNSFYTLGGTFAVASAQVGQKQGSVVKSVLRGITRSVPLVTYFIMTALSLLHISLPGGIIRLADFIGAGNGFAAMLMVGISLELKPDRASLRDVGTLLLIRYLVCAAFALVVFLVLPAPLMMRQILAVALFSSSPAVAVVYSHKISPDATFPGVLNPVTTLLCFPLMALALALVL